MSQVYSFFRMFLYEFDRVSVWVTCCFENNRY